METTMSARPVHHHVTMQETAREKVQHTSAPVPRNGPVCTAAVDECHAMGMTILVSVELAVQMDTM